MLLKFELFFFFAEMKLHLFFLIKTVFSFYIDLNTHLFEKVLFLKMDNMCTSI